MIDGMEPEDWIDRLVRDATDKAERISSAVAELQQRSFVARTDDRSVEVEVNHGGAVTAIRLAGSVRERDPDRLAGELMACIRRAGRDAARAAQESMAPALGSDPAEMDFTVTAADVRGHARSLRGGHRGRGGPQHGTRHDRPGGRRADRAGRRTAGPRPDGAAQRQARRGGDRRYQAQIPAERHGTAGTRHASGALPVVGRRQPHRRRDQDHSGGHECGQHRGRPIPGLPARALVGHIHYRAVTTKLSKCGPAQQLVAVSAAGRDPADGPGWTLPRESVS